MSDQARCIVLRDNKILFIQQMIHGQLRHVFVGGGIEYGETPHEAALRELEEEANVKGKIVFGPAIYYSEKKEYIFIVSISDTAQPTLGYDPELPIDKQALKGLIWRDAIKEVELFNEIDCKFFQALINEGKKQGINEEWMTTLEKIVSHHLS